MGSAGFLSGSAGFSLGSAGFSSGSTGFLLGSARFSSGFTGVFGQTHLNIQLEVIVVYFFSVSISLAYFIKTCLC